MGKRVDSFNRPASKVKVRRASPGPGRGWRLEFCYLWARMATAPSLAPRSMPTYEYACEKCGKNFDAYQSMSDAAFQECPKELCRQKRWGHGKVKRLLGTGAGLIFKGSGFYITDYRSNNYKEGAKKEAPTPVTASGEKSSAKDSAAATPAATPAKTPPAKKITNS